MEASMKGLKISEIGSSIPKVDKLDNLYTRMNDLSKEVVHAANSARGACVGTFFAEKALDTMGDNGIVAALITIPEESTWGKSAVQLLELLDPFKSTIRTTFKPKMVEAILAIYRKNQVCLMCLWPRRNLMVCGRCKEARYCCLECQKSDWRRHRKEDCIIKV